MKHSNNITADIAAGAARVAMLRIIAVFLIVMMVIPIIPLGLAPYNAALTYAAEDDGKEGAADGKEYVFGTSEEYSTFSSDYLKDSFFFSDSWFKADPAERNDDLALVSMQLAAACIDDDPSGSGADFLEKLGFSGIGFRNFASDDPDDCAYVYGSKETDAGTVIAVVIQSYSLNEVIKGKGWKQNFTVNGDAATGEHYSFSKAVDSVIGGVVDLADGHDHPVYWIMGHSRGGALAGMLASRLPEEVSSRYEDADPKVCAYTFEAPAEAEKPSSENGAADPEDEKYSYIHNYITSDDIVTMVPPEAWNMTRYGKVYELGTDEVNSGLAEELKKLGSKMKYEGGGGADPSAEEVVAKLVEQIPTRKDYSLERQVSFTDFDGGKHTVIYDYQSLLATVVSVVTSGKIKTAGLIDRLNDLLPAIEDYARGYLIELGRIEGSAGDVDAYYWRAAQGLCRFLTPEEGESPFEITDAYALLKFAAPIILEPDITDDNGEPFYPGEDPVPEELILNYLEPGMGIALSASGYVFSHHFDTGIARLKTLAKAPEAGDFDVEIAAPAARDSVTKTPKDLDAAVDALGLSWLGTSSAWDTDDESLKRNKKYYLNAKFTIAGHTVPDDINVTINGKAPVDGYTITYKDGVTVIRGTWDFDIGTPAEYEVSFDENSHGEKPDSMMLPAGTLLKHVELPVPEEAGYRFAGWTTYEGDSAEGLIVDKKLTLLANWKELIDTVEITYEIPAVGDPVGSPEVPKDAPYHLESVKVNNSDYDTVTEISEAGTYMLDFEVVMQSRDTEFPIELDEDGSGTYLGTVLINGEEVPVRSCDESGVLSIIYEFTPEDAKTPDDGGTTPDDGGTTPDDGGTTPDDKGDGSGEKQVETGDIIVIFRNDTFTYNGKVQTPDVKATYKGSGLAEGTDYDISYTDAAGNKAVPVDAGSYTAVVTFKGRFTGDASAEFKISKAANTMKVSRKTVKIKLKKLNAKKKLTIKKAKAYKIRNAVGKVTYKKIKVNRKKYSKKFAVNAKTGKITVKKGVKRGTYRLRVSVKAAGNANYKSKTRKITVIIKVK